MTGMTIVLEIPVNWCIFRKITPVMRALKTILIIVFAVLALLIILGLAGPGSYRVERDTTIGATPEEVYRYVSMLGRMKEWGPWQEMDKDQVHTLEGTDGTAGAVWKWEGDTVGTGSQRIVALDPNRRVECELLFVEPFESRSTVAFDLEARGDSTRIVWSMAGENGPMGRIMGVFMDMEEMIGSDFERGLARLKEVVEQAHAEAAAERAANTVNGYLIEVVENGTQVYVGTRNTKLKWAAMEAFYGAQFGASAAAVAAAGLELAGPPSTIFWEWNEQDRTADLMAAMPVQGDSTTSVPGFTTHVIPAGRMLKVAYYGPYDGSMNAHLALDRYIKDKGMTQDGNVIEEYVTDPMAEPDTAKWLTYIYYQVK
jgi:effector-binding domain-containing protein/uncharacterized protein YndB with AHSA1/START domain